MSFNKQANKSKPQRKRAPNIAHAASAEEKKQNSTTMPIPVDAIFNSSDTDQSVHINVCVPGEAPFSVPLSKDTVTIGRDQECDILLNLQNVSREHARIIQNGEEYKLLDLDSTNGTFINNVRVAGCTLHHGDQIRVGQAVMTFVRSHGGPNL